MDNLYGLARDRVYEFAFISATLRPTLAWFAKNVRHVWDGARRRRTMYFATVDWLTSDPEFQEFAVDVRAPHAGARKVVCQPLRDASGLRVASSATRMVAMVAHD